MLRFLVLLSISGIRVVFRVLFDGFFVVGCVLKVVRVLFSVGVTTLATLAKTRKCDVND